MIYTSYIILSMIVAAFAVHDYARETARRNVLYLSFIWVGFSILWPIVIGSKIRKAWRNLPEVPAIASDPRYSKSNYAYRSNYNCSAEYLEKVKQVFQTTPVSMEDINLNEFNLDRRLTVQELDVMAKASLYGVTTDLRDIENIEQLLAEKDEVNK